MAPSIAPDRRLVSIDPAHGRFRVNRAAYCSAEIFELEKELIFGKCWLYLGHATELKEKGDFVLRRVAGRDLIFLLSRDGSPRAFYNTCTHRGAQVCRDKRGNAKNFSCPYHGWVFSTDGKLLSMNAKTGFPANINADGALNLRAAVCAGVVERTRRPVP
jgi:p-cumate 2,3-dioxygenase subunit alpha